MTVLLSSSVFVPAVCAFFQCLTCFSSPLSVSVLPCLPHAEGRPLCQPPRRGSYCVWRGPGGSFSLSLLEAVLDAQEEQGGLQSFFC